MRKTDLAVFVALEDEIRTIRSKMVVDEQVHLKSTLITRGQYLGKSILLVRCGVGYVSMRRTITHCFNEYHPELSINIGYAGSTSPEIQAGDIVIATNIVNASNGNIFAIDANKIQMAASLCQLANLKYYQGTVLTVSEPVLLPHDKAFVGTKYGALAIEMESAAFAEVCQEKNRPYMVIRSILDPMDFLLPDMRDILENDGKIEIGLLASHLARKPKDILKFPKMEYYANQARESITKFIDASLK